MSACPIRRAAALTLLLALAGCAAPPVADVSAPRTEPAHAARAPETPRTPVPARPARPARMAPVAVGVALVLF